MILENSSFLTCQNLTHRSPISTPYYSPITYGFWPWRPMIPSLLCSPVEKVLPLLPEMWVHTHEHHWTVSNTAHLILATYYARSFQWTLLMVPPISKCHNCSCLSTCILFLFIFLMLPSCLALIMLRIHAILFYNKRITIYSNSLDNPEKRF